MCTQFSSFKVIKDVCCTIIPAWKKPQITIHAHDEWIKTSDHNCNKAFSQQMCRIVKMEKSNVCFLETHQTHLSAKVSLCFSVCKVSKCPVWKRFIQAYKSIRALPPLKLKTFRESECESKQGHYKRSNN